MATVKRLLLLLASMPAALPFKLTRRQIARGAAIAWTPFCVVKVVRALQSGGPTSPYGLAKRRTIFSAVAKEGLKVLELGVGENKNADLYPKRTSLVGLGDLQLRTHADAPACPGERVASGSARVGDYRGFCDDALAARCVRAKRPIWRVDFSRSSFVLCDACACIVRSEL